MVEEGKRSANGQSKWRTADLQSSEEVTRISGFREVQFWMVLLRENFTPALQSSPGEPRAHSTPEGQIEYLAPPSPGDLQGSALQIPGQPFSFERDVQQRRTQPPAYMRPPFTPVQACARESAQTSNQPDVNPERLKRLRPVPPKVVGSAATRATCGQPSPKTGRAATRSMGMPDDRSKSARPRGDWAFSARI